MNKKINCSVGILTFNSGKTLKRALESVKDFSNIIISDGGSTDETLNIAKDYGCTIIEQYAKLHPGKDTEHPIEDFSLERNRMLDTAKEDWFFWLDSDEYISNELHDEISVVCGNESISHYAYQVPIAIQSPDASITYRVWKQNYQIRFFNLETKGRFQRKIHEKFRFDTKTYSTGIFSGLWYVPISKMSFEIYKKAVDYRLLIMYRDVVPVDFVTYFKNALYQPIKGAAGVLYRELRLRLRYSPSELAPWALMRNRLYSRWVTFKVFTQLYFGKQN